MNNLFFNNIKIIDEMIVDGDYPNARKFCEKIPVGKRTILRYLKFIKETLCLPLKYDSHKKGYYYENKNKSLKEFFAQKSSSENVFDDAEQKKKRKELIDILKNNFLCKVGAKVYCYV